MKNLLLVCALFLFTNLSFGKQITVTVEKINDIDNAKTLILNVDRIINVVQVSGKGVISYLGVPGSDKVTKYTCTETLAAIQVLMNATDAALTGSTTSGTLTTAGLAIGTFTITDANIASTSKIHATVSAYSGTLLTNGVPVVVKIVPGSGSAVVSLINTHATNALNGTVTINYRIF